MQKHKNPESEPIEYLSWANVLASSPEKYRKEMRAMILEEIKHFSEHGEGHPDTTAGEALYAELKNPDLWEFVGFAPTIKYIRETAPTKEELEALWVHPWGLPALIFKHKKLCVFIMTHPGMRFDKSYPDEMEINKRANPTKIGPLRGITG